MIKDKSKVKNGLWGWVHCTHKSYPIQFHRSRKLRKMRATSRIRKFEIQGFGFYALFRLV